MSFEMIFLCFAAAATINAHIFCLCAKQAWHCFVIPSKIQRLTK